MTTRSSNSYRRVTGRIRLNGRSAVLETNEGSLIYLETAEDLVAFDGIEVVVEGHMSGTDRLALTWIGIAGG